ncbi:hypothetical protein P152DRAFT_517448 [Eremomyces bilateralis CBS 781.70]|uniref:HIT-type domain-containing protein n=1 Tax=Eremomyces bilateralis CBS 781.70 TaxID=1392243 RepID=A0A6G1FS49_9PEZI|nr:uncharacterized protein P152DRAFT_517448 [Eremomyces bilateralis CBS 781.70]KAF1808548.1 hypothetical protein P152DRAFT_517448 [Eremomyces bilateralis CBS 781.70]
MGELCGVCNQEPSKYKCPSQGCRLRYCSLPCYKVHKETHTLGETKPTESSSLAIASATSEKRPPSPTLQDPLDRLQAHPEFQRLFARYPRLPSQLQDIYRRSLPPSSPGSLYRAPGARGRGRGGRFGQRSNDRNQASEWSPENGDVSALKGFKNLLRSSDRDAEGLEEFVELVKMTQERG